MMNISEITARLIEELTYQPQNPLIFSSGLFLFLFTGFSLVYFLLRSRDTARILFVTLFSYYFYYKSSGLYFLLLAFVTVSDYYIASLMHRADARGSLRAKKFLLAASLCIDLGLLGYFKYTNFFAGMISAMVGSNFQPWDIFLPVGISFFTFQSLSYIIDIYRGRLTPLNRLLDYAFYVSFFPQLVAGPIVRATDFIPQIKRHYTVSSTMISRGVFMILVGLFKKAVISDYISLNFVDRVFESPTLYSGFENLLGVYGYTLQIYCDFSGYSDMAIGLALLLGFHFPQNFDSPFKSRSVTEFWRRWHISLSSWIRDYVYIFWLGGNRRGQVRAYANQLLAMLLCGLWHGASLNFVVWGGIHGIMLAAHKFFRTNILHHSKDYRSRGIRRFFAVFLTFNFVTFAFMIFRMPDWGGLQAMASQMLTAFHAELIPQVLSSYRYVLLIILLGYLTHFIPDAWYNRIMARTVKGGVLLSILLVTIAIYIVIQIKSSEIQPFIYFQF